MISRITLTALLILSSPTLVAQESPPDLSRAARGDVREPGGARRVTGDMRETYATLGSGKGHARNVVLLIGDGMGDSEITIARNYAEGAGGPVLEVADEGHFSAD